MSDIEQGKLTTVAKTGGIKVNGGEWINPSNEIKQGILDNLDALQMKRDSEVLVTKNEKGYYTGIEVVEDEEKKDLGKPEEIDIKKDVEKEKVKELMEGQEEEKKPICPEVCEDVKYEKNKIGYTNSSDFNKDYFKELRQIKGEVTKKGNLNYMSWAEAWDKLKQVHPDAQFHVYENREGLPIFAIGEYAMVKVGVSVCSFEHVVWLPVMDHMNKSIPLGEITTFELNKSLQRALAKGICMHGLGLFLYRGLDSPDEI